MLKRHKVLDHAQLSKPRASVVGELILFALSQFLTQFMFTVQFRQNNFFPSTVFIVGQLSKDRKRAFCYSPSLAFSTTTSDGTQTEYGMTRVEIRHAMLVA